MSENAAIHRFYLAYFSIFYSFSIFSSMLLFEAFYWSRMVADEEPTADVPLLPPTLLKRVVFLSF
jgi:hypothetical protein